MADETCPACTGPLSGPRCRSCGAAARPGGYRVLRLICETHHGRMYLARTPACADGGAGHEGGLVALKELVFALAPDARRIDAFEREARLLASLAHPAIPRFVAAFREGEGVSLRLYLAQEYVEGTTLAQRLVLGRLEEDEARQLAREVLPVLTMLHRRTPRLLHRDIKPQNLILRGAGGVALVDFGGARELRGEATHGSSLVGSIGYTPLEQLGGTADARSDLYALGATLVHALSGVPPANLLDRSFTLDFRRRVRASPELLRWLVRMTSIRREDRFASAEEALVALDPRPPQRALQRRAILAPAPRQSLKPRAAAAAVALALHVAGVAGLARISELRALWQGGVAAPAGRTPPAPPRGDGELSQPRRICRDLAELPLGEDGAPLIGEVPVTYVVHPNGEVDQVRLTDARVRPELFLAVKSWLESCAFIPAQLPQGPAAVRVRQTFHFK